MTIHEPAAILWDMDGTIVDTEPAWIRAERALLSAWGSAMHPQDATDWVGIGLWDLAAIFQERGVNLSRDEIADWLTNHVDADIFGGDLSWRPGARELARQAVERGIRNVLVTMAPRSQAERVVAEFAQGTFSAIVAGDDVDHPKPHPEPYRKGAAAIGVVPSDCVAIEDSVTGATSAHRAGAYVIGVPNLVDLSDAPLDTLVDSLATLSIDDLVTLFQSKGKHA